MMLFLFPAEVPMIARSSVRSWILLLGWLPVFAGFIIAVPDSPAQPPKPAPTNAPAPSPPEGPPSLPMVAAPAKPAAEPIRIGVIGPLTGSNKLSGIHQRNGVILAVEEANRAGGIQGRPLEVLAEDDEGNPGLSLLAARRLIQQGVVAILGPINSSCTLEVMPVCAQARVPLLTSSSTATRITAAGNRWVFRCIESDYFRMAALSEYLVDELNLKRIGILYEDDPFGRGLKNDLSRSLARYGIELAYARSFTRDQASYEPELQRLSADSIEALGLFGITPDNLRIAAQVQRAGLSVQLFSPDVNERYLAAENQGLEGLVATDSYYLLRDKPAARAFMKRYTDRFRMAPGPHAGRAYDAAGILVQAMERSDRPQGESLRDAIFSTENYPGVTGDFNFKSNGDVVKKIHIVAIHNGHFVPAAEWKVRTGYQRWIMILVPVLLLLFVAVNWTVGRVRRAVRHRLQQRALREFHPIKVNPYIVGNPVREKEMFFGREDDFAFIRKNLARQDSGVCMVVCGDRRSGKTSILYQILNGRLGPDYLAFLLDLQLYGNLGDTDAFFDRMRRDIEDGLKKQGLSLPDQEFAAGREGLEQTIELLLRKYAGRQAVLLLDEYEILETLIDQGALHASAVDFLSAMLDRHPALSYVLTGSTRLEDRKKSYWRHLIGKSLYRKISFLTQRDTLRLITDPLHELVFHEDGVPERIFRLTAGQPFYTQAICMNIVDQLNEMERNLVTRCDLQAVVTQLVENPLPQMLYFWESFSADEKFALSLLADALSGAAAEALDVPALLEHARSLQLPVVQELQTAHTALEGLFSREVVAKKGRQFFFRMDLLREWVHRDHSPWQIIGETSQR
jgi:branched-chain amino acid transport system substrate-binding protein